MPVARCDATIAGVQERPHRERPQQNLRRQQHQRCHAQAHQGFARFPTEVQHRDSHDKDAHQARKDAMRHFDDGLGLHDRDDVCHSTAASRGSPAQSR